MGEHIYGCRVEVERERETLRPTSWPGVGYFRVSAPVQIWGYPGVDAGVGSKAKAVGKRVRKRLNVEKYIGTAGSGIGRGVGAR